MCSHVVLSLKHISLFAALTSALSLPFTASADAGKTAYERHCQACHQGGGAGIPGVFPPLSNNPNIQNNPEHIAQTIIHGMSGPMEVKGTRYNGMPAMPHVSDAETTAIVNYILRRWGNAELSIDPAQVQQLR